MRLIAFPNLLWGTLFSQIEMVRRTDLLEYQLRCFTFSVQDSIERSGTKWVKQVFTTGA